MELKISEIKIGERFRKSSGSLSSLVASIREVGLLHPVVVSEKNELIAGVRRLEAARLLGWTEIPATIVNIADLRKGEVQENLVRKDFTPSEIYAIDQFMKPNVLIGQGKRTDLTSSDSDEVRKGRTDETIAILANISRDTLRKIELVMESVEKDPIQFGNLVSKMDTKKISINAAATQVRRAQKHTNTPALPEGQFNVIYADPPWKYEFCLEGSPEDHYAEMATNAICDLQIPSAKDAILFLWVTNPKIEDGLKVAKAWGFKYVTNLVWIKQNSKK